MSWKIERWKPLLWKRIGGKRIKRNGDSPSNLCNKTKYKISHFRGPKRKIEEGPEKMFKDIMDENFPNM